MKRLILLLVLAAATVFAGLYIFKSGRLFFDGIKNMQEKSEIAAGFRFAELMESYPYSPFVALARLYVVNENENALTLAELYFKTRKDKEFFGQLVGVSQAYYDPYFFAASAFFMFLIVFGLLQRYFAGSKGLSLKGVWFRESLLALLVVSYILWVRGATDPGTIANKLGTLINPWTTSAVGSTWVSVGFSVIATLICITGLLAALIGFLGGPTRK